MFRKSTRPQVAKRTITRTGQSRGSSSTFSPPIQVAILCLVLVILYMITPDSAGPAIDFNQQDFLQKSASKEVQNEVESTKQALAEATKPAPTLAAIPDITLEDGSTLPSAKTLLTKPPPFDDSKIIKLSDNMAQSPNTVVTGYFRVRSKYKSDSYDGWMKNMLSLQDAMVIFTEEGVVEQVKKLRSHAKNRTVIVVLGIDDLPFGSLYSQEFWQDQLDRDPEKKRHKSYQLFWIWLSKSWLTMEAIRMNFFGSDLFMWSDIGCFRDGKYNGKTMIQHREMVPPNEMMQMAHHKPNPPEETLFNDKYEHKANFYHSGSQFVAFESTWKIFHEYFLDTIDRFLEKHMIIVEDQVLLQSVCLQHPEKCVYVPFSQVNDNHYFGLRYVVHHGGKIRYWRQGKK